MGSLIALNEHGSIREAAKACNISPAAVHKHLKTLESELGVKLYEKQAGRLGLTEAGKIALPFAKEMLLHHDAAFTAITEWKDGGRGAVRVGAGPSFSSYVVPPLIKRFRRRFPQVDVYVETGDSNHLMSRLKSGSLDLVFDLSAAALHDRDLEQVAQWEAQTGFVSARPDVPSHCRLVALRNVPFILFGKGTIMASVVQNYFDSLNFCPTVVMRSDSSEAIKAMIRTGLGISVLFLWNLDSDPRSSMLSLVRTGAPPLSLRMGLIRLKASYTPRAVLEFVELAARVTTKNLRLVTEVSSRKPRPVHER
ncbi:MAG: LysR family transcriptional regulator [Bryobacterales bacterium]|nr:LysR family transcriptional regulator [Bryobacterales bacterium]